MGFSLADFGLVGAGYSDVMSSRARSARDAEDRAYQVEQRKRADQEYARKMEEAARQRAYDEELRAETAKYLAGGEKATPAQPAVQGQALDPYEVDQGAVARAAQPAQPAQVNEEGLYKALEAVQRKHGKMDEAEKTRKNLKAFQDEGVIEFIKKARQGATDDDLVTAFNKAGNIKLSGLTKVDDDNYAGVTQDGKDVHFNLPRMTESLLGAKDLVAHMDKTAERERRASEAEGRAKLQQEKLAVSQQLASSQTGLREAQAELARARAGAAGGAPRGRTSGNWNQFDTQVKQLATAHLTSQDPDTGKPVVDRKNLLKLTSMAQALARRNPNLSPAEALEQAAERMDVVRAIQDRARDQAENEASALFAKGQGKQRDAWVESRAKNLAKMRTPAEGDSPAADPAAVAKAQRGPKPGDVIDGYRFKGGNPNDEANWEPVKGRK